MKSEFFSRLIEELCQEYGIVLTTLDNSRIRILSLNGEERMIWSKKFELNSATSTRIADNKSSTYEVLKHNNISCVKYKKYSCQYENGRCFLNGDSIEDIHKDLKKYHKIVLKPDNGYEGTDVYKITSTNDILYIFNHFQRPYKYICSSPYYHAKAEYRTVCLNGRALLTYKKSLPYVIGNGINSVIELVNQKFGDKAFTLIKELSNSIKQYIPFLGEKVNVGWRFNLSQGAKSDLKVNEEVKSKIQQLSLVAANAIHINFSSVDIIETIEGSFLIMEINSGVVLNQFIEDNPHNYEIAKNIYEQALLSMFNR